MNKDKNKNSSAKALSDEALESFSGGWIVKYWAKVDGKEKIL